MYKKVKIDEENERKSLLRKNAQAPTKAGEDRSI